MSILIGLDAGHGLYTAGKQTPTGIKEWSLNDKVADLIERNLKDYDCCIIRLDNDEGAIDEYLSTRLSRYINSGCECFVSVHHNAYTGDWNTATGVEVYTDVKYTEADDKLANIIYNKMVSYIGLRGRGVKRANFEVINQNKIPAILCEGGFMDGEKDYSVITLPEGQENYARAVSEGLIEFLGLEKKKSKKIDVFYQVWDNVKKKWLPNVKNLEDYAGIYGNSVCGILANLSEGNITYKVHLLDENRWLPSVENREDYAGLFNKPFDAFMMKTDTGKTIKYAAHLKKQNRWLPFVSGYDANDFDNGYAGIFGREIDAIKIYIEGE